MSNMIKFLLFLLLISLQACTLGRFIFYNFADIKDHRKFPNRAVQKAGMPFQFTPSGDIAKKIPKSIKIKGKDMAFEDYLKKNNTVAFLIIRNDTLLYENYFDNYKESSVVPSFSVAKSVLSILIGCAIKDRLIQSVQEPITTYIPELKNNGFEKVTIEHLLQMTSGLDFNEGYYNPFGHVASFYYGRNLRRSLYKLKLKTEPGTQFEYKSGNSQLLGLVLERALKDRTVSAYLEQKLWQPLGMEYDGSWSIDRKRKGLEKTFCCLNARARDYAKIGRLYLNDGNWNGQQIVPSEWVHQSIKQDTSMGSASYYQYQWWLPTKNGDFLAQGILGQYIYVNPAKKIIIVRLGKNEGKAPWWSLLPQLAEMY